MSTTDDTARPAPEFEVDLCGESCPYPVIRTLEAIDALEPGALLEVTTDCPQSFRNIPDEAVAYGSRMIGEPIREGARMSFLIEVGERPADAKAARKRAAQRATPGADAPGATCSTGTQGSAGAAGAGSDTPIALPRRGLRGLFGRRA